MTLVNKKSYLYVISTKSLTTNAIIYYRNVRGNKCRWTEDPNKAYVFSTPQAAAYHVRLHHLKHVHINPIERVTTILNTPPIKKIINPIAHLINKWG